MNLGYFVSSTQVGIRLQLAITLRLQFAISQDFKEKGAEKEEEKE